MTNRTQGGVMARWALLLALLNIWAFTAGCRNSVGPATPRRYVRLEALLPLHPSWSQVAALERDGAPARSQGESLPALQLESLPMPAAIAAADKLPANREKAREARLAADERRRERIAQDAQRRVGKITEELDRRNQDILRRQAKEARKEYEARAGALSVEIQSQLPGRLLVGTHDFDRRISRLEFKQQAFRSQLNTVGQTLADAQNQVTAVQNAIDGLKVARANKEQEIRTAAARELEDRKAAFARTQQQEQASMKLRLETRLAQRKRDLEALAASQIKRQEGRLRVETDADALATASPLPNSAAPPGLPADPQSFIASARSDARMQSRFALARRQELLARQRAGLIAMIRQDTAKLVQQIAHRGGWKLVNEGTPGAADATQQTAEALRELWRR